MTTTEQTFSHLEELFKSKIPPRDNHHKTNKSSQAERVPVSRTPVMPSLSAPANAEELRTFWKTLRAFYRNGSVSEATTAGRLLPALLAPYGDIKRVRHDYPVWISDDGASSGPVVPIAELLNRALTSIAPNAADARILRDNLGRLEKIIRDLVDNTGDACLFQDVLEPAMDRLQSELHIAGPEAKSLAEDIEKFGKALPATGWLCSFSPAVPLRILLAAIQTGVLSNRQALADDVKALRAHLKDLLRIEHEKSPESIRPDTLQSSYGYGSSFINLEKLVSVMPEAATESMPVERQTRIQSALNVLERMAEYFPQDAEFFVSRSVHEDWKRVLSMAHGSGNPRILEPGTACRTAMGLFDEQMNRMAELIAAVRIARLESEGRYDPDIHDAYFKEFDWRNLSAAELASCPPVILIATASDIMNRELADFSTMLSSCRPIKTMIVRDLPNDAGQTPTFMYQQELGALAVSHRGTFVLQSTAIHPVHLYETMSRGLSSHMPAVFHLLSPFPSEGVHGYVWSGAALESRTFPEFVYDQLEGTRWGSRFNVEQNPQADQEWPLYEMSYFEADRKEASTSISLTVADFHALSPAWSSQFMAVPPEYWTDDLVLFAEYIRLKPTEAYARVPFVWMVDAQNVLHKVATTHLMTLVAQERLDFWHFIQEFGGINSYHVDRAVDRVRLEMEEDKVREIAALEEKHRAALAEARQETAREAMEKLTAVLLELDTLPQVLPKAQTALGTELAPAEVPAPVTPESAEEAVVTSDPWIETIRCTSCNECTNLNPNAFKYDGNKQAFIADAKACTYAQLVVAAEKCPAKCIHPGLPLNPGEAGLDDLLKRAALFN